MHRRDESPSDQQKEWTQHSMAWHGWTSVVQCTSVSVYTTISVVCYAFAVLCFSIAISHRETVCAVLPLCVLWNVRHSSSHSESLSPTAICIFMYASLTISTQNNRDPLGARVLQTCLSLTLPHTRSLALSHSLFFRLIATPTYSYTYKEWEGEWKQCENTQNIYRNGWS